ncbi:hypothetical protein [Spirillospora sp. NPDC048824]|uniref:hypothetical protein n=1 Tax=Spirillospora sp. NPDC048824 TaxID=3364526 RepID=UPI00371CC3B0
MSDLHPGESLHNYADRSQEVIQAEISKICDLVGPYDAFDVVELLRQREMPFSLAGFAESQHDGLAAIIEVVSLILISRNTRNPVSASASTSAPNEIIDSLHQSARSLLQAAAFGILQAGEKGEYGPLTSLSAEYRSSELFIRYKQYAHIHDSFNEELFGTGDPRNLTKNALGFTYVDFKSVRDAIAEIYQHKLTVGGDQLAEIMHNWPDGDTNNMPEQERNKAAQILSDWFAYPGQRASFTIEDIAQRTSIDKDTVGKVLNLFSTSFRTSDPADEIRGLIAGDNPFLRTNLLKDDQGNFISVHLPIGTDCFRLLMEEVLKSGPQWAKYDKHRTRVSERLAVEYLEQLFATAATHTEFKYYAPKEDNTPPNLGSKATAITSIGKEVEADAFFLIEDVAICVEVKGRSISEGAKRGHVKRLTVDLERTVGEATFQARRLEKLITQNHGLWLADRTWLDLSQVREVRSIVVCLDDFGPLAIGLDELVRGNILKEEKFPWIVSLHDLATIAEVTERPAEFLLYLRRRTESDVSKRFRAQDELDLYMLFLSGGLYVDPDPEKVYDEYPTSGKPTTASIRRYRRQNVPTRVHTHTDSLDAWIYHQEGASDVAVTKPSFGANPRILDIVDFLQDGKKPGWLRAGSDLLNPSSETQNKFARDFDQVIFATQRDHAFHSALHCYAGCWGFSIFFVCSCPDTMTLHAARDRMAAYMIAKKHQLQSDRALGLLVNEQGEMIGVHYINDPYEQNAELDQVVQDMGLVSPEVMRRVVPPSALRSTHRLRGKKSKKNKKR